MSLQSGNPVEMNCADFQQHFDAYVDEVLAADLAVSCSRHIASCRGCNREVTRWQQTRILLSTAVADFSTAVDVSTLRRDVEAALGYTSDASTQRRSGELREAAYSRGEAPSRSARRASSDRREGSAGEARPAGRSSGRFAAAMRFVSAAGVSAMAAAAAVMVLSPATQTATVSQPQVVAQAGMAPSGFSRASYEPRQFSRRAQQQQLGSEIAQVGYTRPPLAQREVPKVDGLEAAPGRTVSTWVQRKTNARVIWVEDRGLGAPIRTAGLER